MCGILGFVGNDEALAGKMAGVLSHRGPDGEGVFADAKVTLAHRRLAVIDLSPRAAQPLWTPDKTLGIIFNGEIYNFKELRKELEKTGEHFVSDSDTEVILLGFKREGKAFFSKMRGMWALALYDVPKKEIILARDPFGIKPLYYLNVSGHFAFASEMKALNVYAKEKNIRFTFSKEGCASFFTLGYSIHPFTVFNEIKKLEPGAVRIFNLTSKTLSESSITQWREEAPVSLEAALKDSMRHHLIADVPVGVFLSGGVDSTLIALMLKELNVPLHAFTISVEGRDDDAEFATKIAKFANLTHHVITLSIERLKKTYEKLFEAIDEPVADSALLPILVVSEEARKYVTCVLTGEGGDELFLGYERYKIMDRPIPLSLRTFRVYIERIKGNLLGMYLPLVSLGWGKTETAFVQKGMGQAPSDASLSYFDEKFYLPDNLLYKTDIATMAHSLEARTPFLDKVVSQAARQIPDTEKLGGLGKQPLRRILEKRLPKELMMPVKLGFGLSKAQLSSLIAPDVEDAANRVAKMNVPGISLSALVNISETAKQLPGLPFALVVFNKVVSQYDVQI